MKGTEQQGKQEHRRVCNLYPQRGTEKRLFGIFGR